METTAHPKQPIFPMARNNGYKLTKNGMEIDPNFSGHPKVKPFRKIFPFTSRPILVAVSLPTKVWWHKYAWVNGVKLASVCFHPFGEKPLSDPIFPYCQLEPRDSNLNESAMIFDMYNDDRLNYLWVDEFFKHLENFRLHRSGQGLDHYLFPGIFMRGKSYADI